MYSPKQTTRAQSYLDARHKRQVAEFEDKTALVTAPLRVIEVIQSLRLVNALEIEIVGQNTRDEKLPVMARTVIDAAREGEV
jgi:hypothetical protein